MLNQAIRIQSSRAFVRQGVRAAHCLLVCLTVLTSGSPAVVAAQARQKSVLVLYAVPRDAQLAVVGDREMSRLLAAALPEGIDYYSEYMDVARLAQSDYQTSFHEFLELKYEQRRFDAVIAIGDVPLKFVSRFRDDLFAGSPIVFFSTGEAHTPLPNATGIVATPDLSGTLDLASQLQPDLEKVFVVSGAKDTETERMARAQFAPFEQRLAITYLSGLPARELEARLATLPARSAAYYLVVNRDGDNRNFNPLDYLDRIASLTNAPLYSWVDSAMGRGIVGGRLKDQSKQAQAIAALALRVLQGEPPASIPVSVPDLHVTQVDWRQLRRWGLSEARVPAGAVVAFREPSTWDRYRVYIIGSLALLAAQTALIAALLIQRGRRRYAEELVRNGQQALRTSYERIRDLGGRLLQAQDSERAWVARELHDDVSQQLALLEIDLEVLGRTVHHPEMTKEALDRARSVARSVHDLSHRLHPAKLRLIGLTAALKGLQSEMSKAGIPITFTHDGGLSNLSPDVTLCLFRVAQEALQNAVKHSGAHNVAMHVGATRTHVSLSIADDGAGFDVGARSRHGLGLLSMEERVEAVGGHFEVSSSDEAGTRVSAVLPIRAESA